MDRARFWSLIDEARHDVGVSGNIASSLIDKLAAMDFGAITRWAQIYDAYQSLSYKMKLWAAAYVINGGCSDDGFEYFRGWLISQGENVFLRALENPDSLADIDVEMGGAEYEDMLGVGHSAYFKKTGAAGRDYDAYDAACTDHALSEGEQHALVVGISFAPDIDMEWSEGDFETVVPRLSKKFG